MAIMLDGHKPSAVSLSSNILARDFGYGLVLEYRKWLFLTFLQNVLIVSIVTALMFALIHPTLNNGGVNRKLPTRRNFKKTGSTKRKEIQHERQRETDRGPQRPSG